MMTFSNEPLNIQRTAFLYLVGQHSLPYTHSQLTFCSAKRSQAASLLKWTDDNLIIQYHYSGDYSVFSEIFRRYRLFVLGTCIKFLKSNPEAQDASNEIFVKILHSLRAKIPKTFSTWLYVVTKNHCLEVLRKLSQLPPTDCIEDQVDVHIDCKSDPECEKKKAMLIKLKSALKRLPKFQRISLELFYYEGLRYSEISVETNMPLKAVKSNIQNGKRNLKNFLMGK